MHKPCSWKCRQLRVLHGAQRWHHAAYVHLSTQFLGPVQTSQFGMLANQDSVVHLIKADDDEKLVMSPVNMDDYTSQCKVCLTVTPVCGQCGLSSA